MSFIPRYKIITNQSQMNESISTFQTGSFSPNHQLSPLTNLQM